ADAAQAVNGKLYIMGGGWSVMGPEPTPYAIALKVEVPWDETNKRHTLVLRLLDDDGRPVRVAAPNEDPIALEIPAHFGVGRDAPHARAERGQKFAPAHQDLRHNLARRDPGRGRLLFHGGQGPAHLQAGRARHPLYRGWLAGQ